MASAVSEMTTADRDMYDEDGVIDDLHDAYRSRSRAVYKMFVRYMATPESGRDAYVRFIASNAQIQATTVEGWLDVPRRIPLLSLMAAFPTTADGAGGWWACLQWMHLQKAAQAGGKAYGPGDRIRWLVHAANNGLSPDDMGDYLRKIEVIKSPKRGKRWSEADGERETQRTADINEAYRVIKAALTGDWGDKCQTKASKLLAKLNGVEQEVNPSSLWTLLERMGDAERQAGRDLNLAGTFAKRVEQGKTGPVNVAAFLAFAAGEYKREPLNAATFTLDSAPEVERGTKEPAQGKEAQTNG